MFELPKSGQLTQGTVFSCAYAENYAGKIVHGMVITARCDAAQRKVPIYSFIPVVKLNDWVFRDGADITVRRIVLDAENSLENLMEDLGVSLTVLRTTPPTEIVEKLLRPLAEKDRKIETKIKKFEAAVKIVSESEAALASGKNDLILEVLRKSPKIFDKVIKDLAENKILGHYLLRAMPSIEEDACDYVALLREVHHIPNRVAQLIASGVSLPEWLNLQLINTCCPVFLSVEDWSMPVAKLRSPWMEHLMQSWALLFSRIRVEDVDAVSVRRALSNLGLEAV